MRFPAIRFVLYFVFWLFIGLTFLILFYLSPTQQKSLLLNILSLHSFWIKSSGYVQFMDDWNVITVVVLICLFIIVLSGNEIFLRKLFPTLRETSNSFTVTGLIWLGRFVSNLGLLAFQFTLICYLINFFVSTPRIVDVEELPKQKYTILLLGTSKHLGASKNINSYYTYRIDKVVELYRRGLISKIIISGDQTGNYNEPEDMKHDLLKRGVVGVSFILDGKGYRTFDSIIRMRALTTNNTLLIVSQYFHLERALFLATKSGFDAIGIPANGTLNKKMIKREWLAKTKVLLDIYIFNLQASNVAVQPRRHFDFHRKADIIILLFVLSLVSVSGRLSRQIISF